MYTLAMADTDARDPRNHHRDPMKPALNARRNEPPTHPYRTLSAVGEYGEKT